jgi:hypothetical protein
VLVLLEVFELVLLDVFELELLEPFELELLEPFELELLEPFELELLEPFELELLEPFELVLLDVFELVLLELFEFELVDCASCIPAILANPVCFAASAFGMPAVAPVAAKAVAAIIVTPYFMTLLLLMCPQNIAPHLLSRR